MKNTDKKKLKSLLRHISLVQEGCSVLAEKIIENGDEQLGIMLIANSMIHDNSKFYGVEWEYLTEQASLTNEEKPLFDKAILQHIMTNPHHPEYWGGIDKMPRVYLAEAVCDWHARSSEFGTDLREWIKNVAIKKYKISSKGKVYKQIKEFVDLLLERPFK